MPASQDDDNVDCFYINSSDSAADNQPNRPSQRNKHVAPPSAPTSVHPLSVLVCWSPTAATSAINSSSWQLRFCSGALPQHSLFVWFKQAEPMVFTLRRPYLQESSTAALSRRFLTSKCAVKRQNKILNDKVCSDNSKYPPKRQQKIQKPCRPKTVKNRSMQIASLSNNQAPPLSSAAHHHECRVNFIKFSRACWCAP